MRYWTSNKLPTIFLTLATMNAWAAQPLLTITPLFYAPKQLAKNSFTAAIYQVTNNTKTLSSFVMQAIPGVTQVTTMAGSCGNPIQLNAGASCLLNLRIVGSQMAGNITAGPVICNNSPQPISCAQPSQSNSLSVALSGTPMVRNDWISVMIAQDVAPANDLATYMNQIIAIAPSMTQIHLRVTPMSTSPDYSQYVNIIRLFRTAYSTPLLIGFHPDNSGSSYSGWGCNNGDSACVLNHSIQAMNAINQLVDPTHPENGFNIFSLEQGDVEIVPSSNANFQNVKACLNPTVAAQGSECPSCSTCTPTQAYAVAPYVTFGDVTQSYGGCDDTDCYYGPTMLDYTYPQFYNLGKKIGPYQNLYTNGYFPSDTTDCQPYSTDLYVVDVDNSTSPYSPEIPCIKTPPQTYSNIYTYPDPKQPSPSLVAAYMAYLMTQYPPIATTIPLHGATAYITFSGEDFIFGSPGWTPALLNQFHTDLYSDFTALNGYYPALFPSDGTNPDTLQYAIWNFSSMLGQ